MDDRADLIVVGAGIVGLAHALAAVRRGLKVVVLERDAQANGASIRNFGFVTVTGQEAGQVYRRAMRARDIWIEVAEAAGIPVIHSGLLVAAHSPEAEAVLQAFKASDMGTECDLLTPGGALQRCPLLVETQLRAALWSPHERRIEARDALPAIARWLAEAKGVDIRFGTLVHGIEPEGEGFRIETTQGRFAAPSVVLGTGNDFQTLFPERLSRYPLTHCKLQMTRVAPQPEGWRLPCAVMSDSSLVRYAGYAALPESAALRARLEREIPDTLAEGVHLICVQSADGSLVVGDSHDYGETLDPFFRQSVEDHYMRELAKTLRLATWQVTERWNGIYPSSPDHVAFVDAPAERLRIALVTSGTGMSTAFAIGEEVIADLFD